MGDNSPWVANVFPCLVSKVTFFVTDCLFKDICQETTLNDIVSPFGVKGRHVCYPLQNIQVFKFRVLLL